MNSVQLRAINIGLNRHGNATEVLRVAISIFHSPLLRTGLWMLLSTTSLAQSTESPSTQITDNAGIQLQLVPAGQVQVGSPADALIRCPEELPQHAVTLASPYYIGVTEVTQKQWTTVMQTRPWRTPWNSRRLYVHEGDNFPAAWITLADALAFCQKLTERHAVVYRLPTEAEWEHACRYGETSVWSFGDNAANAAARGWFRENSVSDMYSLTHRQASQKAPNPLGLYDMHGNMAEWCLERFSEYPLSDDGRARSDDSAFGVLRGGCWFVTFRHGRSATRDRLLPAQLLGTAGLRVLREVSTP
jgi:formylglycine-generating enzyme required for sulfatase activity